MSELSTLSQSGCAWLTGASSGIGAALSRCLIQKGWVVVGSARNPARLNFLKKELGSQFHPYPLDITDVAALRKGVGEIEEAHGPITLAVLNAGIYEVAGFNVFDQEAARTIFETNVIGTINTLGTIVQRMVAGRRGQIAIMSSLAGYRGLPYSAGYCASRAATLVLAESLRQDCQVHGVKVQVITPGFVDTPMTAKNDFRMPFLVKPEVAAERIVEGLASSRFEISFPLRLTILMKIVRMLPYRLYFPLISKVVGSRAV